MRFLSKAALITAVSAASFFVSGPSSQARDIPARASWVVDETGVISAAGKRQLEEALERFQAQGAPQFQVLVLKSLEGDALEPFALRVAEKYRLGHAGKDDGALLLIALEDRAARIEVGRGLEGDLPDIISGRIIRDVLIPEFREGRFEAGIVGALRTMASATGHELTVEGMNAATRPRFRTHRKISLFQLIFLIILLLVISRFKNGPLGLLGSHRNSRGGWGGGGLGGGGFGGGGFSSGGGGGFSGGGASGRW